MPTWRYSIVIPEEDKNKYVKASLREVSISPKHAVEIAREIKGMYVEDAKRYFFQVSFSIFYIHTLYFSSDLHRMFW